MAEERTKARFTQKEKWFKENWNFEYKPRTDDENKTNLRQHKDLESGSREPNKIPIDFFKLRKRKCEEETNRNIRSSSERVNITNDPLLPILTSLETETITKTNDATEEPIEADFLEEHKSHKRDMMPSKLAKTKKQKNRKIPKSQEKRKTINKNKSKQKQNREENLQNKQKDQQVTEIKKKETMTKPKIFNLSNKALSQQHGNVLRRGLKFLPNKIELKNDVQQCSRKLRLLEFFYKENESEEEKSSDDSIIKHKSAFNPPRNRDKILDQNIDSLNSLNFPDLEKAPKSNLSKLQWAAINDLKNDKNIEIKETDKGGSGVILSKSHYKSMLLSQLNNEKAYNKLNSNPDQAIMKKIKALITKYKLLLTDSEYKYLSHNYFETSNFYGRPKIHKSAILHKVIKEQNKKLITILEPKDL